MTIAMPAAVPRTCETCPESLAGRHANARFCRSCSRARSLAQSNAKAPTVYERVCQHCDLPFVAPSKRQRYCSSRCSGLATVPPPPTAPCRACGVTFTGHGIGCRRACTAWIRRHPGRPIPTACGNCAGPIIGRAVGALYCSRACAGSVMAKRRRAAREGRPVHRIVPLDIFERDRWTCHLCTFPIDRDQRDKQPGAPSIDHLIPVAHPDYPGHIAPNLAAAHWACNVAKGARARPEDFDRYERQLDPPARPPTAALDAASGPESISTRTRTTPRRSQR